MGRRGWALLGAAGVAVMVLASAWAPVQPELIGTGAACQRAPCGTLEDPERWRQAWWLWSAGAAVAAVASALVLEPRSPSARSVLVLVVAAALAVVPLVGLVLLLSILTSVQGVATAAAVVPLVGIAVLGSWTRARRVS